MEPENQQDNFDLKIFKLEIDLSPPTRGQRSLSSRCITGFNLNTCRFLPLPGGEAKSSNLMMFYEGKKSMSMISWSRKGTQAN